MSHIYDICSHYIRALGCHGYGLLTGIDHLNKTDYYTSYLVKRISTFIKYPREYFQKYSLPQHTIIFVLVIQVL